MIAPNAAKLTIRAPVVALIIALACGSSVAAHAEWLPNGNPFHDANSSYSVLAGLAPDDSGGAFVSYFRGGFSLPFERVWRR